MSEVPDFNPAHVYPVVGGADAALRRGDWPGVRSAFAAAGSAYEQHQIVSLARSVAGCEELLSVVCGQDPSDALARTMLAMRQAGLAWEARGSGRASTVSQEQFARFFALLEHAEQSLIEVCAREPEFVAAWNVRLVTSRGLQLGRSETRRRYQRLAAISPQDRSGRVGRGLRPAAFRPRPPDGRGRPAARGGGRSARRWRAEAA